MNLTIRARLTVWYTSLLVLTLAVLGALAYAAVWWLLQWNAQEVLRSKFDTVSAEVEYEDGVLHLDVEHSPTGEAKIEEGLDLVRVKDSGGQILHDLRRRSGVPTDDGSLNEALEGREVWSTIVLDGASFRMYAAPVTDEGQVVAAVEVGRSEAATDALLGYLRLAGAAAMFIGLGLAWFGGYTIAGLALAPVERIRRSAEAINAQGLSRRLGPPYQKDELGALARSLDGMIDRLDQAFRHERQFTADASHELRTPLSIMRTEIEVALRKVRAPDEYQRTLTELLDEVTRLSKLVGDMLTLARIDAGYELQLQELALHDIILTAADRMLPMLENRGLTVQIDRIDPSVVRGDAGWLLQVVLSLVQNAAQHTPRGGTISLTLRADGPEVVFSVADTGSGIAAEHLPHIFERFYRASAARTRADGGAGLGLAICAWVVHAHGGSIQAVSESGKGAELTVRLPSCNPAGTAAGPAFTAASTVPVS